MNKNSIQEWFKNLQSEICQALEKEDGLSRFQEDDWVREAGGGGRSRVISNGNVIEKGGVNFSAVEGETPDKILQALNISKSDFFATGISIVIHPVNPWVPIIHMNLRYFEMSEGSRWFGGGIDVTPHYIQKDDAKFFHNYLKKICDSHNKEYYPKFKEWADNYFYIPHRNETRGIGGIFFDRLSGNSHDMNLIFDFVQSVGKSFAPIYLELIQRNKNKTYTEKELTWQSLRRGRYVEFNLVYDKGTKFGLDTGGRTESILMSLPPIAKWVYDFKPEVGSMEESTLAQLRKGISWIG